MLVRNGICSDILCVPSVLFVMKNIRIERSDLREIGFEIFFIFRLISTVTPNRIGDYKFSCRDTDDAECR